MKKIILSTLLGFSVTSVFALPSMSISPDKPKAGEKVDLEIKFNEDASDAAATVAFTLELPAGLTISSSQIKKVSAGSCTFVAGSPNAIAGLSFGGVKSSTMCKIEGVSIPASVAQYNFKFAKLQYGLASGTKKLEDGTLKRSEAPDLVVAAQSGGGGGGGTTFETTVNYSVDTTGKGAGTFTCDSGATGTKVKGGTKVSCTAQPNGTDKVVISGCPVAVTGNVCSFTASATATETVTLSAKFDKAGSGGGNSGNPPVSTPAAPVPALGLFGLFAMITSMFGATVLVARRKK